MNNIVWQPQKVSVTDREKLLSQSGLVLWFTGLSGSGKSTIATELERELIQRKKAAYLLDGDNIRHGLNADLGFSEQDRKENIRRITEVAALFADAGLITLVSAISPTREGRSFARSRIHEKFVEIYVKASIEACIERDPKGLYKKAIEGSIPDFTGISAPYEEPENPELILDTEKMSIAECVKAGWIFLEKRSL